ncbi:MAG: hypothetical protein GF349_03365 [Candidatus Magasanikbacteria bacterium]|nr:hypothetical protein [Candidatus Magasanikbacteria bacterium]
MNIKKFFSSPYHVMSPHHHYQMTVIFLFVFGFFLVIPYYQLVNILQYDIQTWQWYFFWPWLIFYCLYCLVQRSKITRKEMLNPLKRPIMHWVLLGITIVLIHTQKETNLTDIYSLDIAFSVFSLFLADSYWDFKKINLFK